MEAYLSGLAVMRLDTDNEYKSDTMDGIPTPNIKSISEVNAALVSDQLRSAPDEENVNYYIGNKEPSFHLVFSKLLQFHR
jgi:hypothetical protein